MAAPAKFLFDTDFAAPERATREKAATAAESLHEQAEALDRLVSVFKLDAATNHIAGGRALVVA